MSRPIAAEKGSPLSSKDRFTIDATVEQVVLVAAVFFALSATHIFDRFVS